MRLIDANRLLKKMDLLTEKDCESCEDRACFCCFEELIESAPTIKPEPLRSAVWSCVNRAENVWMCDGKNGCGFEIILESENPKNNGFYYCPSCGAKMSYRKPKK